MKERLLGVLSCILMVSAAHAYTGFGICNFGKQTVSSVICYGPAVLKETTVSGDLKVAGALKAENITVSAMTIAGAVDLQNSTVSGLVDVTGNFQADHVNFQKGLTLAADTISLNHSIVHGSVTISSSTKSPYLTLQCSSAITGSVNFDGKAGVIQITGDSVVQGKIINGAMEFIKKDCTS